MKAIKLCLCLYSVGLFLFLAGCASTQFPMASISLPDWVESRIYEKYGVQASELVLPTLKEQMAFAIWLSKENTERQTGGPFGAAVFEIESGRLVAPGINRVVPEHCSLAHGEAVAIMFAEKRVKNFSLAGKTSAGKELAPMRLVTSSQPCIQCMGMTWWSGLVELVYGARAKDVESITGFGEGPLPDNWEEKFAKRTTGPAVKVTGGVLEEEAKDVLKLYMKLQGKVYNPGE